MTRRLVIGITTLAVTLASCGFPSSDSADRIGDDRLPEGLRTQQTAPGPENPTERVTVWLVEGTGLIQVRHRVPRPADADAVIADLVAGPSPAEQAQGLRTAVTDAAVIESVTVARGTATVAMTAAVADIPAADQLYAVAQLVLTLTEVPGVGAVVFTLDGAPLAVPVPTGETSDQTLYREQYLPMDASAAPTN